MTELFRHFWKHESSEWALLLHQNEWIAQAKRDVARGALPDWCLQMVADRPDRAKLTGIIVSVERSIQDLARLRLSILDRLKFSEERSGIPRATSTDRPLEEIRDTWTQLVESVQSIEPLSSYLRARTVAVDANESRYAELADHWHLASEHLLNLFDYSRFSSLLHFAFEQSPALSSFDAGSHSALVSRFREMDSKSLIWAQWAIANAHADSMPGSGSTDGQLGYLYSMFERKSRFPPIRKLISQSGRAIQAFKPVFMMSPLSVANFLSPTSVDFDIVVFDEASQVRPADALGSIARGRQTIVVGDSQQLPPTSFFDSLAALDGADEDDNAASDIESVLGLFRARQAHERMLRWHYRSRHESLISVSNHFFYDDKLVVFPGADCSRENVGLVYKRILNAPYERSRTRTNPVEARTVAEAVMKHAATQLALPPSARLTLGVAALSVAQRDAILDQLEILRRTDSQCEEFFANASREPFFVRNLENVQGDERDVIFISVGYGRTAEGYLAMGFGPINRAGGERRLNVLFTRARRRCEVFTTLSADDIDLSGNPSSGLRAFKAFLQYAEHGRLDIPVPTGRPADSAFEEHVADSLRRLDYIVETQIGSAGFYIDLAIVDPDTPGRYLLGIECDGAAYHSSRSARDRDRLRQAVLEGLGWRIYRVWSTAWFRNRDRELQRLVDAIKAAKTARTAVAEASLSPELSISNSDPDPAPPEESPFNGKMRPRGVVKYECCRLQIAPLSSDLHTVPIEQLVGWLACVVAVESPVHWIDAARRIADAVGVQRIGNRIQNSIREACHQGAREKKFLYKDEFLQAIEQSSFPIRDRSDFSPPIKKLEYVAPQEIHAAIRHAVAAGYGMDLSDIPSATCRLFGFTRVSEEMRTTIEKHTESMLRAGQIERRGETLFVST